MGIVAPLGRQHIRIKNITLIATLVESRSEIGAKIAYRPFLQLILVILLGY